MELEVTYQFLVREDLRLSLADMKYGLERNFIGASAVADWARHKLAQGSDDLIVSEVASLPTAELGRLTSVMSQVDASDEANAARKWLYIQLKAGYEARDKLDDPLGFVERIYASFDYPQAIKAFVRYMPLQPGVTPGESALLERWAAFLQSEHVALGYLCD